MSWIRVDMGLIRHARLVKARRILDVSAVTMLGHVVALECELALQRPDGTLEGLDPEVLAEWAQWDGSLDLWCEALEALTEEGKIAGWDDRHGVRVAALEREKKRRQRDKAATVEPGDPPAAAPVPGNNGTRPLAVPEMSPGQSRVTERNGTERNEISHPTSSKTDSVLAGAAFSLPPMAERLVSLFYGDATAARRKDAVDQLRDTLDPRRPGARLDRNTFVRAESLEQLDAACQMVLNDPPRNLDLAARFVLQALTKIQARSRVDATEGASARAKQEDDRFRRWRRARATAVLAWEKDHPEEAEALKRQAAARIPEANRGQEWALRVELQLYAADAAAAAGFPELEKWRDHAPKKAPGLTALADAL